MKKKIRIPIYHGYLVIHQTNNFKKLYKKYKWADWAMACDALSWTVGSKKKPIEHHIAFRKDLCTPSIIGHEALHTVGFIFKNRGHKMDDEQDEPQAYLLGWIIGQCHKYVKLKK